MVKISGKNIKYFILFKKKPHKKPQLFYISAKLIPMKTICPYRQTLFSTNNKENIINLSSAEFAERQLKRDTYPLMWTYIVVKEIP